MAVFWETILGCRTFMKCSSQRRDPLIPALLLFVCVLAVSIWAMTRQWEKPLLGPHAFRQTQTAISTFYMAKDAKIFADYITPVLGKPWRLPMELPLYQWVAARWHNFSGMKLDACGKLVSVAAWLACLVPVWLLLKTLRFGTAPILFALILLLSSPLYLFWSNAFLMETTGTLLAASMVACALAGHERKRVPWLLAALGFGILAILCKATTWAVAAGMGSLLLVFRNDWPQWKKLWKKQSERVPGRALEPSGLAILAAALSCLLLPVLAGKLWLHYGDSIKSGNPFARAILLSDSKHTSKWFYGTLEQKLDPATWQHIWRHMTDQLLVPFPLLGPLLMPLILVAGAIAAPRRIPLMLVFLAGFAAGPLVFTNLYFEHSYYWAANGIWLLLAVGTALAGIYEFRPGRSWPQITALGLAVSLAISGFVAWSGRFLPILTALPSHEQIAASWIRPVQAIVPQNRTMLIVGHDWNPFALYYAERKGIAQPASEGIRFPGPEFNEALTLLGPDDKLGAVVFAEPLLTPENQAPLTAILQQLGMSRNGQRTAFGVMFVAEDLQPTASAK
jgi:hypothetical protein